MPQSSSNFLPAASTKYLDPVTVPAAPRKVSFGIRPHCTQCALRFDNRPLLDFCRGGLQPSLDPRITHSARGRYAFQRFSPSRDTTLAQAPPRASPRAANPLHARAPIPPGTPQSPQPSRLPRPRACRDPSRLSLRPLLHRPPQLPQPLVGCSSAPPSTLLAADLRSSRCDRPAPK